MSSFSLLSILMFHFLLLVILLLCSIEFVVLSLSSYHTTKFSKFSFTTNFIFFVPLSILFYSLYHQCHCLFAAFPSFSFFNFLFSVLCCGVCICVYVSAFLQHQDHKVMPSFLNIYWKIWVTLPLGLLGPWTYTAPPSFTISTYNPTRRPGFMLSLF